jgi:superfamily II DNA/RNA helicase
MSFAQLNLDPRISKAIQSCGYTNPTPIQSRCIPDILSGKDLVASAQTGTGKTAAFVLPSLQRLSLNKPNKKPRILILTPTRELASQITEAANLYGKFLQFNIISLVGGMSYHQQIRNLSRPVDIVVATPGRLLDHMRSRRIDLSEIETLIFDEADRMLDMGFIDDVQAIAKATPNNRQTLLFSATVDGKLDSIIKQLLKNPIRINLSEKSMPAKITQELYLTDNDQHKIRLLQHFLDDKNVFKAIIFTATKINADKLARHLRDKDFSAAAIHGDLKQNVRNRTLDELRRGKVQFLVATDVAARGIDVSDITHVFNYDLPKFSEDYVHRIGRTGRAGKTGIAISFALPSDVRHVKRIERYTGQPLPLTTIEGFEPTKRFAKAPGESTDGGGKKRFANKDNKGKPDKKKFWFKPKAKAKPAKFKAKSRAS